MSDPYHYPPELYALLTDTIPRLCRSKPDLINFFRGAGVEEAMLADLKSRIATDRNSINKFDITRTVLTRLNEGADRTLAQRREVLRRVVEFEEFSTCWPEDQLKAKGLVAEIRRVINVKDSFTRMQQEREAERRERQAITRAEAERLAERRRTCQRLHSQLAGLFALTDPHQRGLSLEKLLNQVFAMDGLLIRESFVIRNAENQVTEQIDGEIELDGMPYIVEAKWHSKPLGKPEVAEHLVRVYGRTGVGGLIISASKFTQPAIEECVRASSKMVIVLAELYELILLLEREGDVANWLRAKAHVSKVQQNPFTGPDLAS